MNKNLSQILADLFARPMEGKELSDQIQRLGLEIRLVVQSEDTVFGKFRGLLESLRTIIPDEKQRYQAALQTLSTTLKLSRQEIIKAMNSQLEELEILGTGLMPAQPGWSDGLQGMEARSQQLKGELAHVRGRLTQLESEDNAVQAWMSAREKDLELAEKTVKELFANIAAEISAFKENVEALTAEAASAQPAPPARQPMLPAGQPGPGKELQKIDAPVKKKDGELKAGVEAAPPQRDTKFRRTCPMCRGRFHLLQFEKKWQCFTCAYEEPATDEAQGASDEMSEPMGAATSAETPGPIDAAASSSGEPASMVRGPAGPKKGASRAGSQPGARKKACPVCFKKMIWSPGDKVWRCPAGHHERK